ncbi:MAG TPA: hypothetical protein VFV30_12680 [Novosphingobium sp.]|nr:hypothetical protein [Novosphingobium sp.]
MTADAAIDPVPPSALPRFTPVSTPAPAMPAAWSATVLLHPFSPPPSQYPHIDLPFFQLCIAQLDCLAGEYFSIRVAGTEYGQWWYMMDKDGTRVSTNGGIFWKDVDMGWSLPTDWYGAQAATARCPGAAPLNWMSDRMAEWWTIAVPIATKEPQRLGLHAEAATWLWFDAETKAPMRMMFGDGPPMYHYGDPTQLAFLQMFSFSYFTNYSAFTAEAAPPKPDRWIVPSIAGFSVGNPGGYKPFVWNGNFGMTAFMTPVNGYFNPLPTRVLYKWTPDAAYSQYSDRAQDTLMFYNYNPNQPGGLRPLTQQTALLTGPAPSGMPAPPHSASGFLYSEYTTGGPDCQSGASFPFGQEPPNWVSVPAVEGTVWATIVDNPELCPGQTVLIYSVLFPPSAPRYPEATYLWTWYAPQAGGDGTNSRPVTFMQSQSTLSEGTSLALADYYYYQPFSTPIDPANFAIPPCCL